MENTEPIVKKKRGRKKKTEIQENEQNELKENKEPPVPKKRGRKPKGGKLILSKT